MPNLSPISPFAFGIESLFYEFAFSVDGTGEAAILKVVARSLYQADGIVWDGERLCIANLPVEAEDDLAEGKIVCVDCFPGLRTWAGRIGGFLKGFQVRFFNAALIEDSLALAL